MPDADTAFFGRNDQKVERFYKAALHNLSRDSYVAFRDTRATLIRERVEAFLGVVATDGLTSSDLPSA